MTPSLPWTISRVLTWTANDLRQRGIASPRLDAELLVAHALGLRRIDLYLRFDQPLVERELAAIRALVERRRRHEPVAYILGSREFYGRSFMVDRRVLIPRPETEVLVEAALSLLPPPMDGSPLRALDLCTGSGCVAITLACERPDLLVDAVELSGAAADVARANALRLGVADRVRVLEGSLYKPLESGLRYAVIVSNPPYVPSAEIDTLMPDVAQYEPRLALDGGDDGTAILQPLLAGARAWLAEGAAVAVEVGDDQASLVRTMAHGVGFTDVSVREDLARVERVLVAR